MQNSIFFSRELAKAAIRRKSWGVVEGGDAEKRKGCRFYSYLQSTGHIRSHRRLAEKKLALDYKYTVVNLQPCSFVVVQFRKT